MAHLAPEAASLPETQSTLGFAQRCSQVELGKAKLNATAPAAGGGASEAALAVGPGNTLLTTSSNVYRTLVSEIVCRPKI
jgi:hypothetical protein